MCDVMRNVSAYVHAVVRHASMLCVPWCAMSVHMCMLWRAVRPCYMCHGVLWRAYMQHDVRMHVGVRVWLMDPRGA